MAVLINPGLEAQFQLELHHARPTQTKYARADTYAVGIALNAGAVEPFGRAVDRVRSLVEPASHDARRQVVIAEVEKVIETNAGFNGEPLFDLPFPSDLEIQRLGPSEWQLVRWRRVEYRGNQVDIGQLAGSEQAGTN